MKHALGRATVAHRVVQHAVVETVARDQLVLPRVAVDRQRQLARETVAVENQGLRGKRDGGRHADGAEKPVDVVLDALVGGAQMLGQEPGLFAVAREEIAGQVEHLLVACVGRNANAHRRELEQDRADGRVAFRQPDLAVGPQSH